MSALIPTVAALLLWLWLLRRAVRHATAGWASPVALFALGLLTFYIVPSLYWQIMPWPFRVPDYLAGIPQVMTGAVLLGLPFLFGTPVRRTAPTAAPFAIAVTPGRLGAPLWLCVAPALAGMLWRVYLMSKGLQSRLAAEQPDVFGLEGSYFVGNIAMVYSAFYFLLIACGHRGQRRAGILLWVLDGLLMVMTLHRFEILSFLFRTGVFLALLGVRFTRRQIAVAVCSAGLLIAVIGRSSLVAWDLAEAGFTSLSPAQVVTVLGEVVTNYDSYSRASDEVLGETSLLDDVMYRLYDARSASAVMQNVPDALPYTHFAQTVHVLYAVIPRLIFPDKPSPGETHLVTTLVMPDDDGINPIGTIAELYMSLGYGGVLLGGVFLCLLLAWQNRALRGRGFIRYTWLCVYPQMALWYFAANEGFVQRLTHLLHIGVFFLLFHLLLLMLKPSRAVPGALPAAQPT